MIFAAISLGLGIIIGLIAARLIGKNLFKNAPIFSMLATLIIILATCVAFYNGKKLDDSRSISKWLKIRGTITKSEIQGVNAPGVEEELKKSAILPRLTYEYTVDGKLYKAVSHYDAPGFGPRSSRIDVSVKIVKSLPVGTELDVWYNPENPQESLLKNKAPWVVFVRIGIAMILLAIAIVLLLCRTKETDVPSEA
ncbi:MAG: DUF3592 domain-containing protein [Lentisphaeria bacterium]|nr:DUF3592 domain-containing protein [Lentisphaeria bacterium]NQZ71374.1 DUF3592 domain-containing protein [Lentisphaeria bacterium]